jgi:hypothetical protein
MKLRVPFSVVYKIGVGPSSVEIWSFVISKHVVSVKCPKAPTSSLDFLQNTHQMSTARLDFMFIQCF